MNERLDRAGGLVLLSAAAAAGAFNGIIILAKNTVQEWLR
jgi:hypothetical protein